MRVVARRLSILNRWIGASRTDEQDDEGGREGTTELNEDENEDEDGDDRMRGEGGWEE